MEPTVSASGARGSVLIEWEREYLDDSLAVEPDADIELEIARSVRAPDES